MLRKAFFGGVLGVFGLNSCRISQHDLGQFSGVLGQVDFASKAVFDQLWNVTTVIEVGVRQNHCTQFRRIYR